MMRLADHTRRRAAWMRSMRACALSLLTITIAACGELEPMIEPEVADLQLTVDTLKTHIRDSQRALTELRSELEFRRQEIADAQVARAQLEGRVREAERRMAEARRVIDLQREELAAARTERERISRTSLQLHSQLKQLQKHLSKSGMAVSPDAAPASYEGSGRKIPRAALGPGSVATPAALLGTSSTADTVSEDRNLQSAHVRAVSVRPGDTLWSIARRYRVDLAQLRSMNRLTDNKIVVGQAIWVPVERSSSDAASEKAETNP